MSKFSDKVSLIWNIADLLRWGWKSYEYQDVILPLVVLKRLDSVLTPTKEKVLEKYNAYKDKINDIDPLLRETAWYSFYNTSVYDFKKLLDEPNKIASNLQNYINGFSKNMFDTIERFWFEDQLKRLKEWNLLFLILEEINKVDLSPENVSNNEMWYIFEELLRKFSEMSNETAWEHYTPREVIELMARILVEPDKDMLSEPYTIKTIYDPACGTWWMLTVAEKVLSEINKTMDIQLFWQELNPKTFAICKSEMLIKWATADNIKWGEDEHTLASTLSNDQLKWYTFDYMLSNPPYWVDWKKDKEKVWKEAEDWFAWRFWAWVPRVSDWQFLFIQHMLSKMKSVSEGWSRIAVITNGSPLFVWDAWSWESEIRRRILENDRLEWLIWLPDWLFYNTGIPTFIWILTNKKADKDKWKVKLIDVRDYYENMRKALWEKKHQISKKNLDNILKIYYDWDQNSELVKIFKTTDFAYRQITIERPLRLSLTITEELLDRTIPHPSIEYPQEAKNMLDIVINFLWDMNYYSKTPKVYLSKQEMFEEIKEYQRLQEESTWVKRNIKDSTYMALLTTMFENFWILNPEAEPFTDKKWKIVANWDLRDTENVPYGINVNEYFEKEVKPNIPDAWINDDLKYRDKKDGLIWKMWYEINFTRYFYKYQPTRTIEEIEKDIKNVESDLDWLINNILS